MKNRISHHYKTHNDANKSQSRSDDTLLTVGFNQRTRRGMPRLYVVLSILLFSSLASFAQVTSLPYFEHQLDSIFEKIEALETRNARLNAEIRRLQDTFRDSMAAASAKIDVLQRQIQTNSDAISQTAQTLGVKITDAETSAQQQISAVDRSLGKTTLWAIIGILFAIIASGVVYWLLHKKQKSVKTDIIKQLSDTKTAIDENLVSEFGKQAEAMNALLAAVRQPKENQEAEPDHSLALKVASEINTIERNINLMDAKTKGLKQLTRSVEKMKDNLSANGYDMPQMLGQPFNQGMKVIVVSSLPDENLEKGVEKITKILIPPVNYNGKMIQTAQIEVSVGY